MMNGNLDVWTIQEDGNDLFTALDQIKGGVSIIYDNCTCSIHIGSNDITKLFSTIVHNEESDVLIMITKNSPATREDVISYLGEKNLKFVEINFLEREDEPVTELNVPTLWIAREENVVEDAIVDSVNKGIEECTYYPAIYGNLRLNYINNNLSPESFDGRFFKGLIKMDDKLVLLVNQADNIDENGYLRNVTPEDVYHLCRKNNMEIEIDLTEDVDLGIEAKGPKLS